MGALEWFDENVYSAKPVAWIRDNLGAQHNEDGTWKMGTGFFGVAGGTTTAGRTVVATNFWKPFTAGAALGAGGLALSPYGSDALERLGDSVGNTAGGILEGTLKPLIVPGVIVGAGFLLYAYLSRK